MNASTRNRLAELLADLRDSGRYLALELLELHVEICNELADETKRLVEAEAKLKVLKACDPMSAGHYELHLDPELSSRNRKRIKDSSGSYSECRGDSTTRFVRVPVGHEDLAAELLELGRKSRRVCVVVRAGFGGRDPVLYSEDCPWKPERLSAVMRRVNTKGLAASVLALAADIEQMKKRLV